MTKFSLRAVRLGWMLAMVLVATAAFSSISSIASADATITPTSPQPASGIGPPNVCTVFTALNQGGNPVPGLSADQCANAPGDPAQCSDGIDNDGDGLVDLADPGCTSATDTNEFNVTPPPNLHEDTLALCSDGQDNDHDGLIDLADGNCDAFMPRLTVTKVVINDNGGLATTTDFALSVGTTSVMTGLAHEFMPGTHRVSEATTTASSTSYVGTFTGDCDAAGSIVLVIGDTKLCILTNDDVATTSATSTGDGTGTTTPPVTSGGGGTPAPSGGGGGGNGPPVGLLNAGAPGGLVLGASTTSLPVPASMCDSFLTAFIKPGGSNDTAQVRRLQSFLRDFEGAALTLSGVYDPVTVGAVEAFQTKYASDILGPWNVSAPTGFVYLTTRKKVNEIYCNYAKSFPLSESEQAIISRAATGADVVARVQTPAPVVLGARTESTETPEVSTPSGASATAASITPDLGVGVVDVPVATEESPMPQGGFINSVFNFFARLFGR